MENRKIILHQRKKGRGSRREYREMTISRALNRLFGLFIQNIKHCHSNITISISIVHAVHNPLTEFIGYLTIFTTIHLLSIGPRVLINCEIESTENSHDTKIWYNIDDNSSPIFFWLAMNGYLAWYGLYFCCCCCSRAQPHSLFSIQSLGCLLEYE